MNNIILEDSYNVDYIYSLIIAVFGSPSDTISEIINKNLNNGNAYYIQEYIKANFIYPLHKNLSIESHVVNKFRMFIYNCGWLKNDSLNILNRSNIEKFYSFLLSKILECSMKFIKINITNNSLYEIPHDYIHIREKHINENEKIINLNDALLNWTEMELINNNNRNNKFEYKFDNIPCIIPIFLDIKDPHTKLNKKYVNIMYAFNFSNISDRMQKILQWEIHSLICQNENGDYYTIIRNSMNKWLCYSEKKIPSNWIVDMENILTVKKIMKEATFVFYKL